MSTSDSKLGKDCQDSAESVEGMYKSLQLQK